jgi:hypothetical protein
MKEGQRGPQTTMLVEETLMNMIGMLCWLRIQFQARIVETVPRRLVLEVATTAMVQHIMTTFSMMMAEGEKLVREPRAGSRERG